MTMQIMPKHHNSYTNSISEVIERPLVLLPHVLRIRLPVLRLGVVLVEVPRVRRVPQMRDDGTGGASVVQVVPVDVIEPAVALDGLCTAFDVAQSL